MTARNDLAREQARALLASNPALGPRALAAALGVSPSTAHAILTSITNPGNTMPTPAPSLAAVAAALPSTPAAAPSVADPTLAHAPTVEDAEAAAAAQLAAAMAAVEAAKQAKARAAAEAKARAEAAARAAAEAEAEAARKAEAEARAKAAAEATAAAQVANLPRALPTPTLAAVARGPADLPPIVSRWAFPIPAKHAGWVGRKADLTDIAGWLANPDGPLALTGPKGSGKTSLLREACARARRSYGRVNGHRDMVASDLIGSWITRSDRTLAWSDGPVPAAMRAGAVLAIDEFDRIPSGTLSVLQAAMEGDDLLIPETGERVAPAPGFAICACGNSIGDASGQYSATLPTDAATIDRFGLLIRIDPMTRADLRRMVRAACPTLAPERIEAALMYHEALTDAATKEQRMAEPPSPRRLLALCRWLARGMDPARAVAGCYADRLDATEAEAVRGLASRMLTPDAALLAAAIEEAKAADAADAAAAATATGGAA